LIRRFFLALGVGRQHVTRALPDVIQLPELPADRGVRGLPPGAPFERLAQPWHRPVHLRESEVLRRQAEQDVQQVDVLLIEQARPARTRRIDQRRGRRCLRERREPVVHGLARHPEHLRDGSDGAATVGLQNGEGTAVRPQVAGFDELAA
jgi:hypothetical protein